MSDRLIKRTVRNTFPVAWGHSIAKFQYQYDVWLEGKLLCLVTNNISLKKFYNENIYFTELIKKLLESVNYCRRKTLVISTSITDSTTQW